jgi:hypothetical protein
MEGCSVKVLDIFKKSDARQMQDMPLDNVLQDLSRYGRTVCGQYGSDGFWHCSVEMKVNTTGVQFQVKTDFKQPTPTDAARECHRLMIEALRNLGAAP